MKTINTLIATATLAGAVFASSAAFAVDEYNVSTGTTLTNAGIALRGDDAVALATGLDVTPGRAKFTVERDGVAYYFSSKETMKQFAADPDRYMPQYGGFCAFGVAIGKKLDANPHFADIVDGKLYLFLNEVAFEKYKEDKTGTLVKARKNWPGMHHVAVSEVNGG
ncbi:YHS domain-containing protein [Parvibaculum indicum]|uniref:YHS domain-containing (seleno)protein n=1 Tax=Parvibaculum indicum TaxID=562969 RepID=UPI00141F09CE|nr:YHS domain-containing (seleno)protein [Parvibaculum indicum]NIJ42104.1 YHS domain-containing protein [Parvibaculum indicum]